MRDYGKVAPSFWTGRTGRALRGDLNAQIVALYLMTAPHSTMIGVFHCPVAYIANDTGLPLEGASEGLRRLCEVGFCTLDEEADLVWVHEMARFQIGETLAPKDNRIKWVSKEFRDLPKSPLRQQFFARYGAAYHLTEELDQKGLRSPLEGPSKPLRSQEQEHQQEQEQEDAAPPPAGGVPAPAPIPPKQPPSRSSSGKGGSKPPPGGVIVAEAVAAILADPDKSDEDRFFALRPALEAKGVAWSRAMQLQKLCEGEGFGTVVAALAKTLKARDPSTYLGGIVSDRRRLIDIEKPAAAKARNGHAVPDWVRLWREDGHDVRPDGPNRWRSQGRIFDDDENEVGW